MGQRARSHLAVAVPVVRQVPHASRGSHRRRLALDPPASVSLVRPPSTSSCLLYLRIETCAYSLYVAWAVTLSRLFQQISHAALCPVDANGCSVGADPQDLPHLTGGELIPDGKEEGLAIALGERAEGG